MILKYKIKDDVKKKLNTFIKFRQNNYDKTWYNMACLM